MTSKRLTPEQVHAVGAAALDNAIALMNDATVLARADRFQRAFALGVLAVEEAWKVLCCREVLSHWTGSINVAGLNKALRPRGEGVHMERYAAVLDYLSALSGRTVPLPPGYPDLMSLARTDIRDREQALYVEVAPTGEPKTPADLDENNAREWIRGMAGWFVMLERVWRGSLDEALDSAQHRRG